MDVGDSGAGAVPIGVNQMDPCVDCGSELLCIPSSVDDRGFRNKFFSFIDVVLEG